MCACCFVKRRKEAFDCRALTKDCGGTDRGVNTAKHTLSCRVWTRRFERCRYVCLAREGWCKGRRSMMTMMVVCGL